MRLRHIALATALAAAPAFAQADLAPPNAQGDLSVTIYNNNQALVQDVRQVAIGKGRSRIEFPDVSAMIRPETLSFAASDTGIVEQNFDFDLLTPQKLMEKAIGQTVTLLRTNPASGVETRERAKVLSTAGGVVVQIGDRIEVLRDDGLPVRVIFDEVPPNLRARPTLSVTLESDRGGTRPASLRYLTPGLGWSADYVALYDEGKATVDMQGWVTLTNQTGTTFQNADTLLVAGNPASGNANQYGETSYRRPMPPPPGKFVPGTQTANRERLGDFTSTRSPDGPRSPTTRLSRSASSTCRACPRARSMDVPSAGWRTRASRLRWRARLPSRPRRMAVLAMRCPPVPCASISATRGATRSSSVKTVSATRRWAAS